MNNRCSSYTVTLIRNDNLISTGFCLGFFVKGGGVGPKNIFGATQSREKIFRPSRGSGGMLPRIILRR